MSLVIKIFEKVEDKRIERKKLYPLIEIILVALGTMLCGRETYADMKDCGELKIDFFRKFSPFKNGIPSEDTFERVFGLINPKQFHDCFLEWVAAIQGAAVPANTLIGRRLFALDGKVVRGSKKNNKNPLQIMNAFATDVGLTVALKEIPMQGNEITAIPELLDLLALANAIVTIDAIGCQTKIIDQIIDKKGDFVISLKANQGNLHDDVKTFFELEKEQMRSPETCYETTEKDHGRIEKRSYFFTNNVSWLIDRNPAWNKINSIGCVVSSRSIKGVTTTETRFFISSLTAADGVIIFAHAVRSHWKIENTLHHVLDVVLREDACRVRHRVAAENLAILRRIVLNLLTLVQPTLLTKGNKKYSKRRLQNIASWSNDHLETLLFSFF